MGTYVLRWRADRGEGVWRSAKSSETSDEDPFEIFIIYDRFILELVRYAPQ
jgi:hypothetical protein